MRKPIYSIIIACIIASSCQKPENKRIALNSIKENVEILGHQDLSESEKAFLGFLRRFENDSAAGSVVKNLADKGYSYARAFDSIEKYQSEALKIKSNQAELFSKIADTCGFIRQEILKQKRLRDSINRLVTPKINIARKTTWDYYLNAIELDCNIRNHSAKTIRYLSFDFLLTKDDSVLYRIPCENYLPVQDKIQHDFIFDDRKDAETYQQLESYGLPFYNAGYQVKKIVFYPNDTLAIDMFYYSDSLLNHPDLSSDNIAPKDCPYLRIADKLYVRQDQLEGRFNKFLESSPAEFIPFWEFYVKDTKLNN